MKISIIIVSWNAKIFLNKCLDSIYNSKIIINYEIIVVDNNSTDGSRDLIYNNFPNVILICNDQNYGFAKANNIGIRRCSGEYICLINSDVKVFPKCIEGLDDFLDKNSHVGIVGPKILNPDLSLQVTFRNFPSVKDEIFEMLGISKLTIKNRIRKISQIDSTDVDILTGCFLMIRRDAMNEVGLLDESFYIYGEDKDWCKRFSLSNWKVTYFPKVESVHYGGASSSNAPIKYYIEMLRAQLQYYKKHYSKMIFYFVFFIKILRLLIRYFGNLIFLIVKINNRDKYRNRVIRYRKSIIWLLSNRIVY